MIYNETASKKNAQYEILRYRSLYTICFITLNSIEGPRVTQGRALLNKDVVRTYRKAARVHIMRIRKIDKVNIVMISKASPQKSVPQCKNSGEDI